MSFYISTAAKYYDGKTANPRNVSLLLTGVSFQIMEEETVLETWSLNDLTIIDHPAPPVPGIFGSRKNKDARLYISNAKEWKELYDRLPKHTKKKLVLPSNWSSFIIYIIAAIISLIFLFKMFPRLVEQTAYLIPMKMERAIGQKAVKSMLKGEKICRAPEGSAALQEILQKLKAQTSRKVQYKIYVVNDDFTLNAFAAPGGYLVLYSKIIENAKSPEEVAGVLAHEIAHIDLYHTTKGIMRSLGMQLVLSMMVGGTSAETVAGFLSQMSYSRNDEAEADMHGREIMINAKIDPKGIRKFFETMQTWKGEFYSALTEEEGHEKDTLDNILNAPFWEYLSTHPNTAKRIKNLENLEDNTNFNSVITNKKWNDLKNICEITEPFKL